MKLLMVGGDTRGSWQMRGVQLGRALGARVTVKPSRADWAWADVVVLVKRAYLFHEHAIRQLRVPIVWDVLDYWDQPDGNPRSEADLVREVRSISERLHITQLIGATEAMATAIGGVYVTHHSRLGLTPTPILNRAHTVAYDGSPRYLGSWRPALDVACQRLGLTFVVNPPDVRIADVFVSFRDGKWDGWACRQWKSGVKYVNAIVAGRPVITQPSAAFVELHPVGELVTHQEDLVDALTSATRDAVREAAYVQAVQRAQAFTVDAVADRYRVLLTDALRCAA